jgi:hypothetical protein
MATQSRDEAHRSECFQIRCLKSAVRLEPARRRGYEGLRAIDTAPTVSAAVRGPRDPNFLRYWPLRARFERASRCRDRQYPR